MKKLRFLILFGLIIFMIPYIFSLDFSNLTWENNNYNYNKIIIISLLIVSLLGSILHEKKKTKMEDNIDE
jgi:hypothetical protein